MKKKYEIQNNEQEHSSISNQQIELLFDTYASKSFDEDISLMQILGGEQQLIKYARVNIKTGLSEFYEGREMIVREQTFGNNRQDEEVNNQYLEILKDSFLDSNLIILCLIATVSIILGLVKEHKLMMFEGSTIIISCLLVSTCNAYLGFVKENQYGILNLKLKECKKNSLLRDKKFVERHPEEIKVGDIVQLMPGSTVPADGIVIKGKDLFVDENFLNCKGGSKSVFEETKHLRDWTFDKFEIGQNMRFIEQLQGQYENIPLMSESDFIEEHKQKSNDPEETLASITRKYHSYVAEQRLKETRVIVENLKKHGMDCKDIMIKQNMKIKSEIHEENLPTIDSPILLCGSNIVQGIGQMLVLAVGKNRYYERKEIETFSREEEESALQINLEKFAKNIKILATVAAVLITLIKWIRISIELGLIASNNDPQTTDSWYKGIRSLYIDESTNGFNFQVIEYYIQGLLLLFTILVVSIPEGLNIAGTMAMALSIKKLIENGILVKNVRALESIGNLDLLVFDYTRGFTLNEINFQECIINDSSHDIRNNNEIIPNLKLNEMTDQYKKMLVECLYMDYYKELNINTDSSVKFFQSAQISEYDVGTILLLKSLKFEQYKEEEQKESHNNLLRCRSNTNSEDEQNSNRAEPEVDDKLLDEPCKVIWKINFDRQYNLAFFLVSYRENNRERLRMWIKGNPYSVLECCSHYFEDNERFKITYGKESTFDSKKLIDQYYKNSYKVMSYAYKDIQKITKSEVNDEYIRNLAIEERDLTLFFTYALSDKIDNKAEKFCYQLLKHDIQICVVTKGDKKLANIITKKYLNCEDDVKKKEDDAKGDLDKDEKNKYEVQAEREIFNMPVEDKLKIERYHVSGEEVLKDWKYTAENLEKVDEKTKDMVRQYFNKIFCIYKCSEEVKYIYVRLMKAIGYSTCVTGNYHEEMDVLKESDVSIKMGIDSSYSAIDAANIVLVKGKLDVLMNTIIYGRNMITNVKKFIEYQLTINFSILIIVIVTISTNKDNPFTFLQLLWINLLMDTWAALCLSFQNPRETINKFKFNIKKRDSLVDVFMWVNIVIQSVTIATICLIIYYLGETFLYRSLEVTSQSTISSLPIISGRNYFINGTPDYLRYSIGGSYTEDGTALSENLDYLPHPLYGSMHMTIVFNTFIMYHMFNLVNIRMRDEETLGNIIQQNLMFWGLFMIFFVGQILQVILNVYGGFQSIEANHWFYCIGFGLTSTFLSIITSYASSLFM